MSKEAFEKNNLSWQLEQFQQKFAEWRELHLRQLSVNLPALNWLDSEIVQIIAKIIFWTLLVLLLIWFILQITQQVRFYFYQLKNQQYQTLQKYTQLNNQTLSVTAWLARSQKFRQQGNYRESILCLYNAMLEQLSSTKIIPHQASRTDGEYLRLIQNLPQPTAYQRLLIAHQQLCFGNREASLSLFEECQQAFQKILNSNN